jgi:phosphate transport system permease protein
MHHLRPRILHDAIAAMCRPCNFGTDLSGPGVLPAVIVLSIMILPTVTAISCDALVSVPSKLRMAAYGLGATRWETILGVIVPTASR